MPERLHVAVTGDVDSGKSTLIGRLLHDTGSLCVGALEEVDALCRSTRKELEYAWLLDSFEEERRGELTIDTTQVLCRPAGGREYLFIDVPGHRELLKNMLSGVSYADTAILVVDSQKLVEDQTRRHAFILKLLGIDQVIIVLNKMDLASDEREVFLSAERQILSYLETIDLRPACLIPVSAREGRNLLTGDGSRSWYKGPTLMAALKALKKSARGGELRVIVQDVYRRSGRTVAVGAVLDGELRRGDAGRVLPAGVDTKVKALQLFTKEVAKVRAPHALGLVLEEMGAVARGAVIAAGRLPAVTRRFAALLFCVRPLRCGEKLAFRCAAQETVGTLTELSAAWDSAGIAPRSGGGVLEEMDVAQVVISTAAEVVLDAGKRSSLARFVLAGADGIAAIGLVPDGSSP